MFDQMKTTLVTINHKWGGRGSREPSRVKGRTGQQGRGWAVERPGQGRSDKDGTGSEDHTPREGWACGGLTHMGQLPHEIISEPLPVYLQAHNRCLPAL